MLEMNRVERRALLVGSVLILLGAAVRTGIGPGPASYAWHPVSGSPVAAGPRGVEGAREAAREAVAREEHARRPLAEGERIDPNRDPEESLRRLPGVGPGRARALVEAREAGRFRCRGDLARVPGIGPATVRRIGPHLALPECAAGGDGAPAPSGAPTSGGLDGRAGRIGRPGDAGRRAAEPDRVDVNAASAAELERLPWVGPSRAAQIVRTRERLGGFRKVEDLLEVPGIGPVVLERIRSRVRVRRAGRSQRRVCRSQRTPGAGPRSVRGGPIPRKGRRGAGNRPIRRRGAPRSARAARPARRGRRGGLMRYAS